MARFAFVGPSYTSRSVNSDCQQTLNLYVEANESGQGKSAAALYSTPGTAIFASLPEKPVRAQVLTQGRMFAVAGSSLYEVFADGTSNRLGAVQNDGAPASIAVSSIQLLIASGGHGYVFTLATNVFTADPANLVSPAMVAFDDGYFISLQQNSNKFQLSGLLDGLTWDPAQTAAISVFSDNIVSFIMDHRELWMFGQTKSVVYYDSGATFPFDTVPGAFIEQGISGQWSPTKLDNSVFWWGQDERGNGIAWRAQGYTPARISNHAVETAVQGYATSSDVICYAYQDSGHTFWVSYFPTANKTWVYDVATGQWHERGYLEATGSISAHRSQCHVLAFGKHLVGDWNSGNIYQMSNPVSDGNGGWLFTTDAGNPIKRVRRAPHISSEQEWIFHRSLQVDVEAGLGPAVALTDGNGNARDPQISLRWSDDGGHTWSYERVMGIGQAGKYKTRAIWTRLGRSRDRVYEISCADPIPLRIVDAYLNADPGYGPQQRLTDRLRQQA